MPHREFRQVDNRPRNLTDADAEAIAQALQVRLKNEFYQDVGKGVWGIAWKVIVAMIVAIAAYGASQSIGSH
jgi:hypothetical protein